MRAWNDTFRCVILLTCFCIVGCFGDRVVTTDAGAFQGVLDERGYYKFLGIPYGQVSAANPFGVSLPTYVSTVVELLLRDKLTEYFLMRFQEATPHPALDGVFQANSDAVACPQIVSGQFMGSVDCLNLHVYVPSTATATCRLPVIIWIYGGYFMFGHSGEAVYSPRYLVRHDVIFVAINYRTGPYGFMCLGIDSAPGNQGLKDQQLAFEWVQKNIEAFGGNPEEVTLAGISAGAHSIDFHLLSQRDAPYNKVIMQSGSSLARTVFYKPDRQAAVKIAEHLGLSPTSSRSAISLLAAANAQDVVRAVSELNIEFKPCVESEFDGVDPFITSSWINAAVPKARNISVLIGFNEYERMNTHIGQGPEYFANLDIFTTYLNQTFDFTLSDDDERFVRMVNFLRRFYVGDEDLSQEVVFPIINFDSDFVYNYPIQRSIKKFLEADARDIFYYMFAYSGERNYGKILDGVTVPGAAHADELGYLFDISILSDQISAEDQLVLDRMTTMWTNFAKYG